MIHDLQHGAGIDLKLGGTVLVAVKKSIQN